MRNNNTNFIFIIIIILVIGGIYIFKSNKPIEVANTPTPQGETSITGPVELSPATPFTLSTQYISSNNWPPRVESRSTKFTCTPSLVGNVIGLDGKTEKKTINGTAYCVSTQIEGAAGSMYHTYVYTKVQDVNTSVVTAVLRYSQCANYDEPNKSTCTKEQKAFDVDSIMDEIFTVDTYSKANIANIVKEKAVLGGTWMATSIVVEPISNMADVTYEDGHIQGKIRVEYTIAGTQVTIGTVTKVK